MRIRLNHFLGGIFLVAGTTIGAGMLGTPVLTGFAGFYPSLALFAVIWLIMLFSALFLLDVNLEVPGQPNMVSMAGATLGKWGKALAWVTYLLLLYSLIAAYIAGSSPLFSLAFESLTGKALPASVAPFMLPLLFGGFVYLGTAGVDLINRFLMIGLIVSYFLIIGLAPHEVKASYLEHADFSALPIALTVVITSFGYHIIIPTLTTYMKHERQHLIATIVIGSLVSLLVYSVWQWAALGIVPLQGENSLVAAYQSGGSVTQAMSLLVKSPWMTKFAHFFSFFAIVTSFLGVSLSLSDFLTDGLKIKKSWEGRVIAMALVFVPPLFFVFRYPQSFLMALEYGGALVAILLIFLPAAMAWKLKKQPVYRKRRGRILLTVIILFALGVVAVDICEQLGWLKPLISRYV